MLEEELIYECTCGNRAAQKELYEKYSPFLFAVCRRYASTREDAEDMLIIGFTTIFERLDTFKQEGSFKSWMKQIIVNTALNEIRDKYQHYKMKDENEELSQRKKGVTSENMIYSQVNTKYIMEQIQQLSEGYRMVFNLYAIDGYSYHEISKIMKITVGTVRSQLAKARKILQEKLQNFEI